MSRPDGDGDGDASSAEPHRRLQSHLRARSAEPASVQVLRPSFRCAGGAVRGRAMIASDPLGCLRNLQTLRSPPRR
jgi:hypothetical protein